MKHLSRGRIATAEDDVTDMAIIACLNVHKPSIRRVETDIIVLALYVREDR